MSKYPVRLVGGSMDGREVMMTAESLAALPRYCKFPLPLGERGAEWAVYRIHNLRLRGGEDSVLYGSPAEWEVGELVSALWDSYPNTSIDKPTPSPR